MMRSNYEERTPRLRRDPELLQSKVKVHQVKLWLCEWCLQGAGVECHTASCALFLHNSPGYPIHAELYEILKTKRRTVSVVR